MSYQSQCVAGPNVSLVEYVFRRKATLAITVLLALLVDPVPSPAAYEAHGNDRDVAAFREARPGARGGRLDNCALCHAGDKQTDHVGKLQRIDCCTHCHETTRMGKGPLRPPLNLFGRAYLVSGRNAEAIRKLGPRDSDGDGASNDREFEASTFPGDPADRPGLVRPPLVRLDGKALEALPRTSFTLLVNTHKSGDFYASYEGVSIENLLEHAGVLPTAEQVTFFCPDGYELTLPLASKSGHHVLGVYPRGHFFPGFDWVSYPPGLARSNEDSRENGSLKLARGQPNLGAGVSQPRAPRPRLRLGLARSDEDSRENGSLKLARGQPNLGAGVSQPRAPRPRLRLGLALGAGELLPGRPCVLLAMKRDGEALAPGHLRKKPDGRLTVNGEGPYRLVIPQAVPSAPDQPSNRSEPAKPYPFDESLDHNGGLCIRSVVAIRVEPLPPGTADFDWSREGWHMVDTGVLVIYGALRQQQPPPMLPPRSLLRTR